MRYIILVLMLISTIQSYSQQVFYGNKFLESRKTLVFFHPYMNNENFFKFFSEQLIKDFNLVFLRGGKGEDSFYNWYDLDNYSDSFINFEQIENIVKEVDSVLEGIKNVILIGYSQGGVVVNNLMLKNPKKYNRIISINSYLDVKKELKKEQNYEKVKMLFIYGKNDFLINNQMIIKTFEIFNKFKIKYKSIEHFNYHEITKDIQDKVINYLKNER